ncbi:MAG TPA: PLAT/LH2 domain-containing protein [Longimicrobium sp.]
MSTLSIVTSLSLPPLDINNISKASFTIPANVQAFSFHVWYDVSRFPGGGYLQLQLRGPNNARVPTDGQPYLYDDMKMYAGGLSQGYVAATVPANTALAANVSGTWEARVNFSNVGAAGLAPADCTVRICQRAEDAMTVPGAHTYSVPVNFFYVGSNWRGRYTTLLRDAIAYLGTSVFQQAQLQIVASSVHYLPGQTLTSDLYSAATSALVSANASAGAINVFVVEQIDIRVPGAQGFSMLPGPQGFMSPYTCVFVNVRNPDGPDGDAVRLGRRIAHEVGHYLGLTHRSACLDAPCIVSGACTQAECDAALTIPPPGQPEPPLTRQVSGNLMFTRLPGNVLNAQQRYLLLQAPIVNVASPQAPPTPVTSLKVKIKTGNKVYSWWRGDGAGTDDKVYFSIGKDGRMPSQEVSSFWNDFEANSDWEYTLDPQGLNVEDIAKFTISKSYDIDAHSNLFGDDAWLLDGIRITVNGQQVYDRQGINTWLVSDGSPAGSWGDSIAPINPH